MDRILHGCAYGAAFLTILFALALPILLMPVFLSWVGGLNLKIAPWFSGGESSFVVDRGRYKIQVYRPVYPGILREGEKGFVQMVWKSENGLPERLQDSLDLNGDGAVDCEISFLIPREKDGSILLTVLPRSPWVLPVQNSPTTSLTEVLAERGRKDIFIRIPVRRVKSS